MGVELFGAVTHFAEVNTMFLLRQILFVLLVLTIVSVRAGVFQSGAPAAGQVAEK